MDMPWVKAIDHLPPENEEILIFDGKRRRIEVGQYINGKWYVENLQHGEFKEVIGVTHWAPVLDSESYDESEDD